MTDEQKKLALELIDKIGELNAKIADKEAKRLKVTQDLDSDLRKLYMEREDLYEKKRIILTGDTENCVPVGTH